MHQSTKTISRFEGNFLTNDIFTYTLFKNKLPTEIIRIHHEMNSAYIDSNVSPWWDLDCPLRINSQLDLVYPASIRLRTVREFLFEVVIFHLGRVVDFKGKIRYFL